MYLGMQNDLIALVAETKKELNKSPFIEFTEIIKTDEPVELIGNQYYLGEENIINAKKENVRNYRNRLLEKEVDPIVSNDLRWGDMKEEEKQLYIEYRRYLLDFTNQENWWESKPLTFEEWKE